MTGILLDTRVVLSLLRGDLTERFPEVSTLLVDKDTISFVSVASFWEIAIKTRLGKLDPGMALEDMAGYLETIGARFLQIKISHVTVAADPEPGTKDPFDRLLLAQCDIEGLLLVTADRALDGPRLTLTF